MRQPQGTSLFCLRQACSLAHASGFEQHNGVRGWVRLGVMFAWCCRGEMMVQEGSAIHARHMQLLTLMPHAGTFLTLLQ